MASIPGRPPPPPGFPAYPPVPRLAPLPLDEPLPLAPLYVDNDGVGAYLLALGEPLPVPPEYAPVLAPVPPIGPVDK